jgi:hypothetical protein
LVFKKKLENVRTSPGGGSEQHPPDEQLALSPGHQPEERQLQRRLLGQRHPQPDRLRFAARKVRDDHQGRRKLRTQGEEHFLRPGKQTGQSVSNLNKNVKGCSSYFKIAR